MSLQIFQPSPKEPSALAANGLTIVAPGGEILLSGVGLAVTAGERLAIVGPNGAGKSTLLRALYGRLKPSAGQVLLDGSSLAHMPLAERARRIAVVAQSDVPEPRLTVSEYVALGRLPFQGESIRATDTAMIEQALDRLDLGLFRQRPIGSLSGGERQRAALARALVQDPSVLILDEPTNHLDPRARADLLDLVRALGITVIAVLHDLMLVPGFADRVAVLQAGRLVVCDTPEIALSPVVVREVFAIDSFPVVSPVSGRHLIVFDSP